MWSQWHSRVWVASLVDSRYSCSPMATSEKVAFSSVLARLEISKNSLRWRSENVSGIGRGCNGAESARAKRERPRQVGGAWR